MTAVSFFVWQQLVSSGECRFFSDGSFLFCWTSYFILVVVALLPFGDGSCWLLLVAAVFVAVVAVDVW